MDENRHDDSPKPPDDEQSQSQPPQDEPSQPPPPPRDEPAQPPPSSQQQAGSPPPPPEASQNRQLMLILAYLWILALIPLLVEQRDPEVQWHSKNGLVLTAAEIIIHILLAVIWIFGGCIITTIVWLAAIIIRIVGIMKAMNGERFRIPGVSDLADQWK